MNTWAGPGYVLRVAAYDIDNPEHPNDPPEDEPIEDPRTDTVPEDPAEGE